MAKYPRQNRRALYGMSEPPISKSDVPVNGPDDVDALARQELKTSTRIEIVNDRRVNVPADMKIVNDGMFQQIEYRNISICTFEVGTSLGVNIGTSGGIEIVADFEEARSLIDDALVRVDIVEDSGVRNVELRACFPDDIEQIKLSARDLRDLGIHVVGGGAAPIFTLVPASQNETTTLHGVTTKLVS